MRPRRPGREAHRGDVRHPDQPALIPLHGSALSLELLDRDPPGTWLAQPKLNGWRRVLHHLGGGCWNVQAKKDTARKPLPVVLLSAVAGLPWPGKVVLDCEWVGPRGGDEALHIFDMLGYNGEWLGDRSFETRYHALMNLFLGMPIGGPVPRCLELVPCWPNPGLLGRFADQLGNPESEGLVIRRADSGLVGSFNGPATNPAWYKVKFANVREREKGGVA